MYTTNLVYHTTYFYVNPTELDIYSAHFEINNICFHCVVNEVYHGFSSVVAPMKFMKLEHIGVLYSINDFFDNWFFTMSLLVSKLLNENFLNEKNAILVGCQLGE